jgi:hypothetical protein
MLKYHVIVYHQAIHSALSERYLAAMDTKAYGGSRARTTSLFSTGMTAAPANARLALRQPTPRQPPTWDPCGPDDPDPICSVQSNTEDKNGI